MKTARRLSAALACAASLAAAPASAAVIVALLRPGQPAEMELPVGADDSHFTAPIGYAEPPRAAHHVVRRVTIENVGAEVLREVALTVNGRSLASYQALAAQAGGGRQPPALYTLWKDLRFHSTSGSKANRHALGLLNFWGGGYCGDDTAALSGFFALFGIPARQVPLNGHTVGEYFAQGRWQVLDGDQQAVYLKLDNATLASYADLQADPFLALRTKVFGKYQPAGVEASWFNSSLFELAEPPAERKRVKAAKQNPAAVSGATLYPGERLILHYDTAPAVAAGAQQIWWKDDALALGELVIHVRARPRGPDGVRVHAGFPIVEARNRTTGEFAAIDLRQPTYEVTVPVRSERGEVAVFFQRSRVSLPRFRKGGNTVEISGSPQGGQARLTVEYSDLKLVPPSVRLAASTDAVPALSLRLDEGVERIWWQISPEADFSFVPPSLDAIQPAADRVELDPLAGSFLNAGQEYHARAKAERAGAWGDWSPPIILRARKPAAPRSLGFEETPRGLALRWAGDEGAEHLVFASNRLDFLPEVYGAREVVAMRGRDVLDSRPNRNLLAATSDQSLVLPGRHRFYRVISRRGGTLSTPSALIALPEALAAGAAPALVLQTRWRKIDAPANPAGYEDEYLATERPILPP
jgi:hypothetical protein